jgi:hypothetical protein
MSFDFYVHGFWIIGAILFFFGGLFAGNLRWLEGTTEFSFVISVILAFVFFLLAAMFWISAAVNARKEETVRTSEEETFSRV